MAMPPEKDRLLPYGRQSIDDSDIAAVADVLRSDFLTTGPAVEGFEQAFASVADAPYVVACSSGTAALHLAVLAVGVEPGDRVIVPSVTFLATANAPRVAGAEIVFADVDPDTGLMTADTLQEAMAWADGDVKAVFPVHLNGQVAPMPELSDVARGAGIAIVEDACHAIATRYQANGTPVTVGSAAHSDLACFSFHAVKTIAMGEGGAVTGRDPAYEARLRQLRSHGMVRDPKAFSCDELARDESGALNPWYYEMPDVGYNYRASDIHCALGLSQLKRLDSFVTVRKALASRYDDKLAALAPVVRPVTKVNGCDPVLHLYAVLIDFPQTGFTRREVMEALRERGVGTQVHYIPVHLQPYYRARYGDRDLPGARSYYERCLSLPLYPAMTDENVDYVVASLVEVLGA